MMAPVDFDHLFASYLLCGRDRSLLAKFLAQRPEKLSTEDAKRLAIEAITGWLNSKANRFLG